MWYFAIMIPFFIALQFVADWLLFKLRGKAKADHEHSPVVTCQEDARAQRVIDLSKARSKKK